ncbi:MAG: hypothetical protein QXX68_02060 [Candidatus Pacearchaeota archaeon]
MENKRGAIKNILLVIVLNFFVVFSSAQNEISINSRLNDLDAEFFIKFLDECSSDPFDSYDFILPPLIDDYSLLFSRYKQENINLSVDCWNPRGTMNKTLDLVYKVVSPANQTGELFFYWDPSDFSGQYFRTNPVLVDLETGQRINMSSQSSASFSNSQRERNLFLEMYFEGCGDGIINLDEHCDGQNLGGKTCVSLGYAGGNLSCNPSTCRFDLRQCFDEQGNFPSNDGGGSGGGGGSVREEKKCIDECVLGSRRCVSNSSLRVCGDFNGDNCTEWGNEEKCLGISPFCKDGFCYGCLSDRDCRDGFCINGKCEINCNLTCKDLGYECGEYFFCGKIVSCGNCSSGFCNKGRCSKLPEDISKLKEGDCEADFLCSPWSECKVFFDFEKVILGKDWFKGKKERVCFDKNKCYSGFIEKEDCYLKREVFFREVTLCGKKYIEIYDKKTNELISRLTDSRYSKKSLVEIFLLPEVSFLCEEDREYYKISLFDRVMFFLNLRKVLGVFEWIKG